MPTTQYKEARICECGYTTFGIANWSSHKKRCKGLSETETLKQQVCQLEKQLAVKDRQIEEQLAASK